MTRKCINKFQNYSNFFQQAHAHLAQGLVAQRFPALGELRRRLLARGFQVHETTLGLSWTLNPMVRIQLNDVFLWAPNGDRDGDGENDNFLVSGAKSDRANPETKNLKTSWENAVMGRVIFRI